MILAPVHALAPSASDTTVTLRLIGTLDGVLVQSMSDAFAGMTAPGRCTLIVLVRDLVAMRDENLDRFLALLDAYRAAGNEVFIDGSATWRKTVRGRGPRFDDSALVAGPSVRRQIIICHSADRRVGAA